MTIYSSGKTGDFSLKELNFSSLTEFFKHAVGEDRQFFPDEESKEEFVAPVVCGMANGAGGWIVMGAVWDESEDKVDVHGVSDITLLRERLAAMFSEQFSVLVPVALYTIPDSPVLLLHVWPVPWYSRPVCVKGDYARGSWRRIEGVNVVSGLNVRFRLGMDALERSRSDLPMADITSEDLHHESVAAFRKAVVSRRPDWSALSLDDFLSRALVTSNGHVTQAGYLLLGRQAAHVRVELQGTDETFEVRNLWRAWSELLPRLTRSLSAACAAAFRECFVNALLHSEHDAGRITVIVSGGVAGLKSPKSLKSPNSLKSQESPKLQKRGIRACFENPGLARAWRSGESECRNFRLMKMFQLFGAAQGAGKGLDIIRRYAPDFRLEQNILKLTTVAGLWLEPCSEFEFEPVIKVVEAPVPSAEVSNADTKSESAPESEAEGERESAAEGPQILFASSDVLETQNLSQDLDSSTPADKNEDLSASASDVPPEKSQATQGISFGSAALDLENFVAKLKADEAKAALH